MQVIEYLQQSPKQLSYSCFWD